MPDAEPAAASDAPDRAFLALLPQFESAIRFHFRAVPCADRRRELACEALALCWKWHVALARRGKCPAGFATGFALMAARSAASGRRLCGQEPARDLLSDRRLFRRAGPVRDVAAFAEQLSDVWRAPVPDQVQFRLDFPAWRSTLAGRGRAMLDAMAAGHKTHELAAMFGVSPARVSQVRRELGDGWRAFCGDDPC